MTPMLARRGLVVSLRDAGNLSRSRPCLRDEPFFGDPVDKLLSRLNVPSDLIFRAMFSAIFLAAGAKHVLAPEPMAARLVASPNGQLFSFAPPELLIVLSGVVLVAGGLGLLLGAFTRLSAAALFAVLVPITLAVQVGNAEGMGPLLKNVALLGGLIHFVVRGPGALSLDGLWVRRNQGFSQSLPSGSGSASNGGTRTSTLPS